MNIGSQRAALCSSLTSSRRMPASSRFAPSRGSCCERATRTVTYSSPSMSGIPPPVRSAGHATASQGFDYHGAAQLQGRLQNLSARQLADALWDLAKRGGSHAPSREVIQGMVEQVRRKLPGFHSQDLSNTLWALAVLKYSPTEDWWKEFESQVYNELTTFSGPELANLMWSFAVLDHQPTFVMESLLSHASDQFMHYSPNSLHLIVWSLGKLEYQPSKEWMESFTNITQACFFQFSPNEMSNIIWALAKLGHKLPVKWLDGFLMVSQWRFPSFSAKMLSIVVWSAAMLEHCPTQEWINSFEEQVRAKFEDFSGQELACIAWALRKFGYDSSQNTVFKLLGGQDRFLQADFDILSNPQLLNRVLKWNAYKAF